MLLDGSHINLGVAFVAGVAAFFAPCVIPLLPAYVGFFAGTAETGRSRRVLGQSLLFALGFVAVFVVLGLSATALGHAVAAYRDSITRIGGVLMVLLGLVMMGAFKQPFLYRERKMDMRALMTRWPWLNALLLGVTFGFAWTPCIGPVLAVILFWASQSASMAQGVSLLLLFGLGIATPFVLVSVFLEKLLPYVKRTQRWQQSIHVVAGAVVVLFGVLLVLDLTGPVFGWLSRLGSLELYLIDHL